MIVDTDRGGIVIIIKQTSFRMGGKVQVLNESPEINFFVTAIFE